MKAFSAPRVDLLRLRSELATLRFEWAIVKLGLALRAYNPLQPRILAGNGRQSGRRTDGGAGRAVQGAQDAYLPPYLIETYNMGPRTICTYQSWPASNRFVIIIPRGQCEPFHFPDTGPIGRRLTPIQASFELFIHDEIPEISTIEVPMLDDIARANFRFSQRARSALDALAPSTGKPTASQTNILPYIFWAYEVRQMKDDEVVKRAGPGYFLGVIPSNSIKEGLVIARDGDRFVALALKEAYQEEAPPLARESRALKSLATYVAHQSRGLPLAPQKDERLAPARARGEALLNQRLGQLNLSCKGCHDMNAGQKLGGSVIPEAHPTGYPIYRLEWQTVGSLQRRLRNCMIGVRAEPFAYGSDEFIALELYLAQRAAGMTIETPGVRP
jgi:sulfur oxidation c-type cytochrome SoxA